MNKNEQQKQAREFEASMKKLRQRMQSNWPLTMDQRAKDYLAYHQKLMDERDEELGNKPNTT